MYSREAPVCPDKCVPLCEGCTGHMDTELSCAQSPLRLAPSQYPSTNDSVWDPRAEAEGLLSDFTDSENLQAACGTPELRSRGCCLIS